MLKPRYRPLKNNCIKMRCISHYLILVLSSCMHTIGIELQLKCCLQADEYADKFLQDEHSFDDYVREVRGYHRLADEITYTSVKVHSSSV